MRILAVDTATESCSVAVIDGQTLLAEAIVITGETHSKHLMNLIHAEKPLKVPIGEGPKIPRIRRP